MINCFLLILIFQLISCRNITIPNRSILIGSSLIQEQPYAYNADTECYDTVAFGVDIEEVSAESFKTFVNKNGSYYTCEFNFDFDSNYWYNARYKNLNLQIFSHWNCEVDYDVLCNVSMPNR